MKISTFPEDWAARKQESSWSDRFARGALFRVLKTINNGYLTIDEDGEYYEFGDRNSSLRASIVVSNPSFYRMVLLHGSIGAGEAYMSSCWNSPDLTRVIQLICRNMEQLTRIDSGWSTFMQGVDKIKHTCTPNSRVGSRKNISAHYDLSNDLFQLFLDPSMMYSSAVYKTGAKTLEDAQKAKMQSLADKLDIDSSHHILEIGTGWGAMAVFLAENYGCKVTTTTISREQHEFAVQLVKSKNVQHLVTVLDKDYRELSGTFDRLISIEMIEAVGEKFMPGFFRKCDSLVKPGGKLVLQSITIPEQRYQYASRNVDFIQKYIFPGGFLPSVQSMLENTGKQTRLQLEEVDSIGIDYAETLAQWRKMFLESREDVQALGFDNLFIRLWEFYFCYCEGGFRERSIDTVQAVFRRV